MPVSSTQTLVGSVIGIDLARRTIDVGGDAVKQILSSWIFTFPSCAIISGILTGLTYQCFYNIPI